MTEIGNVLSSFWINEAVNRNYEQYLIVEVVSFTERSWKCQTAYCTIYNNE